MNKLELVPAENKSIESQDYFDLLALADGLNVRRAYLIQMIFERRIPAILNDQSLFVVHKSLIPQIKLRVQEVLDQESIQTQVAA
jgi:hypothetical protein